nr:nucleolar and coiled-body phosphoprotein 1-like [Aegilops tauschii subsp. strangulata]
MDAKCVHPRLTLPTEMPQSDMGWSCAKLTDERATLVLEQMITDLKPGNTKAAKDGAQVVAARPTFDRRGLVSPAPTEALAAPTLVELSSDDDEAGARQEKEEPPAVPTRGRSALISRDAAPALTPPGAASGPSAAPSSVPGARAPAPQASRLSGFKLTNRRVDYAAVDRPTPVTKKRKEGAVVPLETNPPTPLASPSVEKGGIGAHVSPARLSSQGMGENPREESAPMASLAPEAPASDSAAEASEAQEPPASQAMAPSQAVATSEKEKQAAAQAAATREAALTDVEAAKSRCQALEAELKTLRNESAEEARGRQAEEEKMKAREDAVKGRDAEPEQSAKAQAVERGRLEELERKVKAEEAELDAKAKVLAEDRVAFALLEERQPALNESPEVIA